MKTTDSSYKGISRIATAYGIALGAIAIPYLFLGLGWWIFARNFTRAASGPLLHIVRAYDLGINALYPHAFLAGTFWLAWMTLVVLTHLKRMPFAFHLIFGMGWCFYGFIRTLAI